VRKHTESCGNNDEGKRAMAAEQNTPAERPALNDRAGWRAYWDALGQPWRTEPEIGAMRQATLAERRGSVVTGRGNGGDDVPLAGMERLIHWQSAEQAANSAPFAGMKLDRADVEWLLATHESRGVRGPVDADDPAQRLREGPNLQGVDLRQAKLGGLPLARANLSNARLERANFSQAHLERASFANSQCAGASFTKAWLIDASFRSANLRDVLFTDAHLESANLYQADCQNASFYIAHLEGAYLGQAQFGQATMRRAFFDPATSWNDTILWDAQHVSASLADARWNGTNLATLDWSQVRMIGDEREARSAIDRDGQPKTKQKWQDNWRRAVRANRQLAVALRAQGMNEEADRFAYRAQVCQRALLRRQGRVGAYLWSGFLDLLAGYGFKPVRTLLVYLIVIFGYATAYFALQNSVIISPTAALIFSITSFHGRGFFPGGLALDAPVTILAATEAIVGLVIEVSFIATFTQRFFAR
jgi:uncharacterized protein YjbI with pentapeptide repeats